MTTNFTPKNAEKIVCENCNFICCKISDYNRHLLTRKHKILQNTTEITPKIIEHICDCGKSYKHRSSLWNHQKQCSQKKTDITPEIILNIMQQNQEFKDLILEQNKHNQDLQKQMFEIYKNNNTMSINNNNNNNSNNKTFNLQVFLNETCKDAMNIMDFADSIKLQLTDLENVGEYGFVNGISKFSLMV